MGQGLKPNADAGGCLEFIQWMRTTGALPDATAMGVGCKGKDLGQSLGWATGAELKSCTDRLGGE